LDEETIKALSKYFTVQSQPSRVDLNSDSAKNLAQHPYISYDLAWVLINYRKQNGDIKSLNDLRKVKALDTATLDKLRPYLD
ncbi:MAG: helix-hairpin-helix domain-containing protein, partial [Bacteroidota bacterium]